MLPVVPPPALALFERQGGFARRRDLYRSGLTRWRVERLVSSGALRVLAGGVLSARLEVPPDEDLRCAVIGLDGTASHSAAARAWGIELLEDDGCCHVTVGRNRSRAAWPQVEVHRRDLGREEQRVLDGLRLTSPLRTVWDLSLALPLTAAVASADSALRAGLITVPQLRRGCAGIADGRERSQVAGVVRLVDPASGSVLESASRVLFHLAGLPAPQTQFEVRDADGRLLGRVDFAWPAARLVVETDGYAFHADRRTYREDRRRTNALVLAGWRVLRFSWEDVRHDPGAVTAAVQAALSGR